MGAAVRMRVVQAADVIGADTDQGNAVKNAVKTAPGDRSTPLTPHALTVLPPSA